MKLINTEKYDVPTVEFGTGEVYLGSGFMDEITENIGVLSFKSQKPQKIGEKIILCDAPASEGAELRFRFTKIESIDAVIDSLNDVKEQMIAFEEAE